jgi:hypothetical protein
MITKASGEQEPFNIEKFKRSLRKVGLSDAVMQEIINKVLAQKPQTTRAIHHFALEQLAKMNKPVAARYNLKHALIEFGPAGYPFEQYVARLLQKENYHTETDHIVAGACVNHEVDVIAIKNDDLYMIECKFHNDVGLKTDVKVTLYIHARFNDINKSTIEQKQTRYKMHSWIFSNTSFTSDAVAYAQCVGLRLTSWTYPENEGLVDLINKHGLHPITALTSLSRNQKKEMIKDGIILCADLEHYKTKLRKYHLNEFEIQQLLAEANAVKIIQNI